MGPGVVLAAAPGDRLRQVGGFLSVAATSCRAPILGLTLARNACLGVHVRVYVCTCSLPLRTAIITAITPDFFMYSKWLSEQFLIDHNQRKSTIESELRRTAALSEAAALSSLLRDWMQGASSPEELFSLGVFCEGACRHPRMRSQGRPKRPWPP